MGVINIEVVSDFVCAWCFIGKRQVEQAISLYQKTYPGGKNDEFRIIWKPYYLGYCDSADSIDKVALADTKLASMTAENRQALGRRMELIGQSVAIQFNWGGKIGRTQDAHRLVSLAAKSTQMQNDLVELLFRAYHEQERDISDRNELLSLAAEAGLSKDEALACLNHETVTSIDAEERQSREMATGVPTVIIQGEKQHSTDVQDLMDAIIRLR